MVGMICFVIDLTHPIGISLVGIAEIPIAEEAGSC